MKALIIMYNRLVLPSKMADFLSGCNIEPVFIDNNSDYPPLLEFYEKTPHQVIKLDKNFGHRVIWDAGILDRLGIKENHIITDPDLDLTGIPKDFLQVLEEGLLRYPQFDQCGFSLETNDLPHTKSGDEVRAWESGYWKKPLDSMYFEAPIDTTFALCKAREWVFWGVRTNRPYIARHVPWYYTDLNLLPEDEQYYFKTANSSFSWKDRLLKP